MTWKHEVLEQMACAGLMPYLRTLHVNGQKVQGTAKLSLLQVLRQDIRFVEGPLHKLHRVGDHPTEFRSHTGELCPGSLQIVVDKRTGVFEADIDKFSPYSDAVGAVGHAGEVVVPFLKKIGRKLGVLLGMVKKDRQKQQVDI